MMQRAGKAAWEYMTKRWPQAKSIAIVCGAGNNGGDGYTLAHVAHEHGLQVTVWQVGDHGALKNEALYAFENCKKGGVAIHPFLNADNLHTADIIVDAICGIGIKGDLRQDAKMAIEAINRSRLPVLAMDIPSGIDADTGSVLGAAVRATATITFIGLKLGLLTGSGVAYTGELHCDALQLPAELFSRIEGCVERIKLSNKALKSRPRDWHKGNAGHVLIVGGAPGFSGAPRMAAEAALRVGAGLVTVATHPAHAALLNLTRPEIMCVGVRTGLMLRRLLSQATVVIVGPGLGQDLWASRLFKTVIESQLPLVVDADGLNLLASKPVARDNWILTPHPGEAARLIKQTPQQIQKDRLLALQHIQQFYDGVCVLKGAGTVVAVPHAKPALCEAGNPGMATAGMGDVLSGVIGGLLAQGVPLGEAAKMGVYLHAAAGDLAAKEGERGMVALDLMPYLRRLVNE
jgi:NAD(P)H-hydrate epimerase